MTGRNNQDSYLYDAFVSYATDPDYQLVRELEIFLETFHETHTPSEITLRPLQICVDGSDFTLPKTLLEDPNAEIPSIIESYLASSRYLLVVSSRGAQRSSWMCQEIEWFLANRPKQRILLAVSEGKDPSTAPEVIFPKAVIQAGLHHRIWYDLRGYRRDQANRWHKVRDFDDNRVRLAADLQGVSASDVLPSWYRAKQLVEQQEYARRRVSASRTTALTAQSLIAQQFDLALLLSVEALDLAKTVEARNTLFNVLERHSGLQASLHGHKGRVSAVAFTPEGKRLISAADDSLIVWDIASGGIVAQQTLAGKNSYPRLALSCKGQVAVSCVDDSIRVFSIEEHGFTLAMELRGHEGRIRGIAFSESGKRLVTCSFDKTIRIWDLQAESLLRPPISEPASAVVFGLDESKVMFARNDFNIISSVLQDNGVYMLDVDSGDIVGKPFLGHRDSVQAIGVDQKRRLLISADHTAILWNLVDLEELEPALVGHTEVIWSVAITPDGRLAATGSEDQSVQVWDTSKRVPIRERLQAHSKSVHGLCFDPEGRRLATGADGGELLLWDLQKPPNLRAPFACHPEVNRAIFTPAGNHIVSCGNDYDNSVVVWDAWTGEQHALLSGHGDNVRDIAIHPSGDVLASSSWDNTVCLWSMVRHELIGEPLTMPGRAGAVAFSPDGGQLAVAYKAENNDDKGVILFSFTGALAETVRLCHDNEVTNLCFSPDGRQLVMATQDEVRVWEWLQRPADSRALVCPGFVHAVAFSEANAVLAAVTSHGFIHLWHMSSLEPYGEPFRAHTLPVFAFAFRSDGAMMATGAVDTVALWDTDTKTSIGTRVKTNTKSIVSVDFSMDSKRLVTAGYDGLITLWDVSEDSWAEKALLIANRDLSETERIGYLFEPGSESRSRMPERIIVLPAIEIQNTQGRLRGTASESWREFEAIRREQQAQLDKAAIREEEAIVFAEREDTVEALAAFDDAITVYRELKDELSIVPIKLATILQNRGAHLLNVGHIEDAITSLSEAREIARKQFDSIVEERRKIRRVRPDTEEIKACRTLALSESNLGISHSSQGELKKALMHLSVAIELWEYLLALGADLADKHQFSWALSNRGDVLEVLGDVDAAASDYAKAVSVENELLRAKETSYHLECLVQILDSYAGVVRRSGRSSKAVEIYADLAIYATRLFGDTGELNALGRVATATRLRADCLREAGNDKEINAAALAAYDEAIRVLSDIVSRGSVNFRSELASALEGRSLTYRDLGNLEEAMLDNVRSLAIRETGASQNGYEEDLAKAWFDRCNLLDESGLSSDALVACNRAVGILRDSNGDKIFLGLALITQSRLLEKCNDIQGSIAGANEAIAIFEPIASECESLLYKEDLARAITRRAHAYEAAGEWAKAIVDYKHALEGLDMAVSAIKEEPLQQQFEPIFEEISRIANNLAWLLATNPQPEITDGGKALMLARRACEISQFKNWEYLDTLAAAHARLGDYEKARKFVHDALSLAPPERREPLTKRLAAYEENAPYSDQ